MMVFIGIDGIYYECLYSLLIIFENISYLRNLPGDRWWKTSAITPWKNLALSNISKGWWKISAMYLTPLIKLNL